SDDITQDNNSAQFPAPVFDVLNSEDGATVQLFRTLLDSNGNIVGQPVLVNTLFNKLHGVVPIADINQSNPSLKTAGPAIPDGTYLYTAQLTDLAGNVGQMSQGLHVTIVTATPQLPAQPVLVSDTGTFPNDDVTSANNSATSNAPMFS